MEKLSIETFVSIYEDWKASGLSVQQYCENIGMRENRFYYWKADEQGLDYEGRAALRQELAYPIIRALEAWALTEKDSVLPKSPIGKAIGYLLNHIRQLSRYTTDGRYKIDNNPVKNSVRPLALGRKNYLFCGNHDAAEESAIIYTF